MKRINWRSVALISIILLVLGIVTEFFVKTVLNGLIEYGAQSLSVMIASLRDALNDIPAPWARNMVLSSEPQSYKQDFMYVPSPGVREEIEAGWQQILEHYIWQLPWTLSADQIWQYSVDFYAIQRSKYPEAVDRYYSNHNTVTILRGEPQLVNVFCVQTGNICVIYDYWDSNVSETTYHYPSGAILPSNNPCKRATVQGELWWVENSWKLYSSPTFICAR